MKNSTAYMCEGPLFKKIVFYTIPIICTGILQLLFNAADLVVVGRFCGSISVGAVGATSSLINLIVNFFIGLSVGVGVTVAHAIGAGHENEIHRTVHTAIPTAVISGIILTVVGLFFAETFLKMMDTPDDVIGLSTIYMKIYFCGVTFSMIYNFGAAILRAAGDTKSPLLFLTAAGILNVILNVVFVYFFKMDVAGVALATSISQAVSAVLIIIALMKRRDACRLELRRMKIYKKQVAKILTVGVPAGIQSSLFAISNVIIQSSINSFDSVAMSGSAAAVSIEGFVYTSMNSFHQTALNFVGQNMGAKKYDRIGKIAWICLLCVAVTGLVLGVLSYIFGRSLLSIYITDSEEAIGYGLLRLKYVALPYFLCGLMDVTTGVIRGMGSSIAPMVVTVLGVCVMRIGWIYTIFRIPQYHTLQCLFVSYPISWLLTFTVQLTIYLILRAKQKKKLALESLT